MTTGATPAGPSEAGALAYGVDEFAKKARVGRDTIYDAIREGRLKVRKLGVRTLILDEDGMDWLRSLPIIPARSVASTTE